MQYDGFNLLVRQSRDMLSKAGKVLVILYDNIGSMKSHNIVEKFQYTEQQD